MTPAGALRALVLAAVALASLSLALGVSAVVDDEEQAPPARAEAPPDGDWYRALAAPYTFERGRRSTACGHATRREVFGVAHPVLPCGAKLTVFYDGTQVLTQVVDRGTGKAGRELELTMPLARRLGLSGVKPVLWRFAAPPQR